MALEGNREAETHPPLFDKTDFYQIAERVVALKHRYPYTAWYCRDYAAPENSVPEATFEADWEELSKWEGPREICECKYLECLYYLWLLTRGDINLHASALSYRGRAYLFCASSGTGKSTHARFWRTCFPDQVVMLNDDKPVLRKLNGVYHAFGTPWCGKEALNTNTHAPVQAICLLHQGLENRIQRISAQDALAPMMGQTLRPCSREGMEQLLTILDDLLTSVPLYEMQCMPSEEAARMACRAMRSEE